MAIDISGMAVLHSNHLLKIECSDFLGNGGVTVLITLL
jgi:hypothetical protein